MKKKRRSSNSLGKLWIFTALLIVAVIAGLIYLQKHNVVTHHVITKNKTSKTTSETVSAKPRFDFYTILPQAKHESPPPATFGTLLPAKKIPAKNSNNTANTNYMLQIASVKDYAEADRLKAELTLQGYTVKIQQIKLNNLTWNRVNLGPYNKLSDAQAAQTSLQKNKVKSILLKIKT